MGSVRKTVFAGSMIGAIAACGGANREPQEIRVNGPLLEVTMHAQTCGPEKCFDITLQRNTVGLVPGISATQTVKAVSEEQSAVIVKNYPEGDCRLVTGDRPKVVITSEIASICPAGRVVQVAERTEMTSDEFCKGGYRKFLVEDVPAKFDALVMGKLSQ